MANTFTIFVKLIMRITIQKDTYMIYVQNALFLGDSRRSASLAQRSGTLQNGNLLNLAFEAKFDADSRSFNDFHSFLS